MAGDVVVDLIQNERVKLASSWMNALSAAVFAAGVVFPLVNMVVGTIRLGVGFSVVLCGVCTALTVAIHGVGRFMLGKLDVD
jgi:VIT1/CCC1 family predicted Fe2+/Mn2+ transporter